MSKNSNTVDNQDIIKQLEEKLRSYPGDAKQLNVGAVEKFYDGVARVSVLSKAMMGELIDFSNGSTGVVLNLDEDSVSIILLDRATDLREGDTANTTGRLLSIEVNDEILGRVINPLGIPLDGKPQIKNGTVMQLERIAAGVIEREPVDTPLKTGIKAIDAMIPIGRGQRELIIGDRGLGKTAIAIDAILNQKSNVKGQKSNVICIYVAIGQKQSTVAQIIGRLKDKDALDYTIVIAANAPDPAALQYLSPYAGAAIAEYFMQKGQDVLIVYDDLTKHAWAYRQIS